MGINNSQKSGYDLGEAWIDVGKKETTLGMTYVALSLARNLSSLIIEQMTYDRLSSIKKLNP